MPERQPGVGEERHGGLQLQGGDGASKGIQPSVPSPNIKTLTLFLLQGVAARHGLPEHRLQMGSPWSSEKPAAMDQPVTHKELEALKKDIAPVTGQHHQQQVGGGRRQRSRRIRRGGGGGRGGGRGGGAAGSRPAWQIIVERRSGICPLFNYGACPKTAETCQAGKHQCSKQTAATMLCLGNHAEKDCR